MIFTLRGPAALGVLGLAGGLVKGVRVEEKFRVIRPACAEQVMSIFLRAFSKLCSNAMELDNMPSFSLTVHSHMRIS